MVTIVRNIEDTFKGLKVGNERADAVLLDYSGTPESYKICTNIKKLLSQLDQAKAATKHSDGKVYVEYRLLQQIINCMEVEDEIN